VVDGDDDLVALATEELATLGLVQREDVEKASWSGCPRPTRSMTRATT